MSLNQAVAAYTSSWEGHAENEGDRYVAMVDLLSDAPLDEIQLEANALTSQELWVPSVIDAFYDALLDRILNETTFCISTAWTTVQHWLTHPYVTIQVGFNDFYHVLDQNGDPIRHDQPYRSYTLMNASFTESQQYQIIRMLLDNTVIALINLGTDITIVGLESAKDPSHRIIFSDLGPSTAR